MTQDTLSQAPCDTLRQPRQDAPAPACLGVRDLAAYLGVSRSQARKLLVYGLIPRVEIPSEDGGTIRRLLCARSDVDTFIARHTTRTSPLSGDTSGTAGENDRMNTARRTRKRDEESRARPRNSRGFDGR
jgi:hypothetical protein